MRQVRPHSKSHTAQRLVMRKVSVTTVTTQIRCIVDLVQDYWDQGPHAEASHAIKIRQCREVTEPGFGPAQYEILCQPSLYHLSLSSHAFPSCSLLSE